MKKLADYLENLAVDRSLAKVVLSLAKSVKEIAEVIKVDRGEKVGTENAFGEDQVKMDVMADQIANDNLQECGVVGLLAGEELEDEVKIGEGEYAVAHDPLDGSSLIDVNLAVGSIFSVYQAQSFYGISASEQMAAVLGVYGPRTTLFVTVGQGVTYFILKDGEFVLQQDNLKVAEEGKMFAPGNLRACASRKSYLDLLNYWAEQQYTLRYSGGMVPDVGQILLKGKGIFTYPGYDEQPDGKLRLLYECAPMAMIMEQAGGKAVNDKGERILDLKIENLLQRTPILIGSAAEVDRALKYLEV